MSNQLATSKIRHEHHERCAYVYVRQSTMQQVRENTTSTQRQYDLTQLAADLGWEQEKIVVVDQDQARSGTSTERRDGFKRMLSEIALGNVGAVISLEASRLTRDSSAWHQLLKICEVTNTLIIDEMGIYDPRDRDARLLLGLKGSMSEAELNLIISRMMGARKRKAEEGRLCLPIPIGLTRDTGKNIVLDPNEEVQNVIRLLFDTFDRFSSVRMAVQYFNKQGILFPTHGNGRTYGGEIKWVPLKYNRALAILHNPAYAGAYVYGRTKSYRSVSPILPEEIIKRVKHVSLNDWEVLIHNHHAGYITWGKYIHNQKRITDNSKSTTGEYPGAVRAGAALLQGIILCGRCGRRIDVRYPKGRKNPTYRCISKAVEYAGPSLCLSSLPGELVDRAVADAFLKAIEPAQLQLSISTLERLEADVRQVSRQWELRLESAKYEADLARRRFIAVEPENRLAARTLEREWNEKLVAIERLQREREAVIEPSPRTLSPLERRFILNLARDVRKIWYSETTTHIERKQLLRYLIKDVTVVRDGRTVHVSIRWQTGAYTQLDVALGVGAEIQKTDPATIDLMRKLSTTHTDQQIADYLNDKGILPKRRQNYTRQLVSLLRYKYNITFDRKSKNAYLINNIREDGRYRTNYVAKLLNVSSKTVVRWCKKGLLDGIQAKPQDCWWITLTPEIRTKLQLKS